MKKAFFKHYEDFEGQHLLYRLVRVITNRVYWIVLDVRSSSRNKDERRALGRGNSCFRFKSVKSITSGSGIIQSTLFRILSVLFGFIQSLRMKL